MRVSLCTIARNEEKALKGLLRDFRDQNYPHRKIEVIMIDSGSTDHTRDVMEKFQNTDNGFYDVKIYTSNGKNQASAWNVAIEHATGDIIIRVDAHSKIPRQFVSRNVFNIQVNYNGQTMVIDFDKLRSLDPKLRAEVLQCLYEPVNDAQAEEIMES